MTQVTHTLLSIILLAAMTLGCQEENVEMPSFDVQPEQLTLKVGETPLFNLSGYADYISFYSGDKVDNYPTLLGNRYQYKDRVTAEGSAYLQFSSALQNAGQQQESLSVLVSTDFNGVYDSASVKNAVWTDITDKFTLSDGTSAGAVSSGLADLSEFKDKPIFLAFKYSSQTGTEQPSWVINNLSLVYYAIGTDNTIASTDTFTVANLNPAWQAVSTSNPSQRWNSTTSQLRFTGGDEAASANEDWVISRYYYLNRVPADKSIPIKTYTDAMPVVYQANPYTKPGDYVVNFVATNANSKKQSSVVRSFIIKVVP